MKLARSCPHCGKALALVESERFGSVAVHQSPLCPEWIAERGVELVSAQFVFVGLVKAQGIPRCAKRAPVFPSGEMAPCLLSTGHRGVCRPEGRKPAP